MQVPEPAISPKNLIYPQDTSLFEDIHINSPLKEYFISGEIEAVECEVTYKSSTNIIVCEYYSVNAGIYKLSNVESGLDHFLPLEVLLGVRPDYSSYLLVNANGGTISSEAQVNFLRYKVNGVWYEI